jgi:hypothetical protein
MEGEAQFICSSCGADRGCDCNAPAIPKSVLAARAIEKAPNRSNRVIAEEIGIDEKTVRKARKATADQSGVQKRKGKDGRERAVPRARPKEKSQAVIRAEQVKEKAQAEGRQLKALDRSRLSDMVELRSEIDRLRTENSFLRDRTLCSLTPMCVAELIVSTMPDHVAVVIDCLYEIIAEQANTPGVIEGATVTPFPVKEVA